MSEYWDKKDAEQAAKETGLMTDLQQTPIRVVSYSTLSVRQRKILAAMAQGKTIDQIAEELGATRQTIHNLLQRLKGRLPEVMDDAGLTDAALVNKYLLPLLNAETTEFAKFQGVITDSRDVADNGTRLSALDMAFKLKGSYPKQGSDTNITNQIVVNQAIADLKNATR